MTTATVQQSLQQSQQTSTATKIAAVTKAVQFVSAQQSCDRKLQHEVAEGQGSQQVNPLSDLYVDSLIPAIVTSYSDRRGYGFCTVTSGKYAGENVFFHASCQRCCAFTSDMRLAIGVSPVVKKRCSQNCVNSDNSKIYIEPALSPGCEILIAEPHKADISKSSAETTRWMLASEVAKYEEMLEILPVFVITDDDEKPISSGNSAIKNPRKALLLLSSAMFSSEAVTVTAHNDCDSRQLTVREAADLARIAKEELDAFLTEMA